MLKPITTVKDASSLKIFQQFVLLGVCLFLSFPVYSTTHFITTSSSEIVDFTNFNCDNNTTQGGIIEGNETGCNDPEFNPSLISNVVLPSGGTGTIEYLWMYTTDDLTNLFINWNIIPNTNSEDFDPTPITETTHYVRCSRRAGCVEYNAESNPITKTIACTNCEMTLSFLMANDDCGLGEGSIMATATNGTPPYTYNWDNQLTTASPSGLVAGAYTLTLTDAVGCELIETVSIASPSTIDIGITVMDATCGVSDGSILLNPTGGTPPYTYLWDDPAAQTTAVASNLAAGSYMVEVSDEYGCLATETIAVSSNVGATVQLIMIPPSCMGGEDGSIQLSVQGNGPFTFDWDNAADVQNPTNLTAGMYCVLITDANDCELSDCIEILDGPTFSLDITPTHTTCAQANGSIDLVVTGAVGGISFDWDNASNVQNPTDLAAGTYCVTVTQNNGCLSTACTTIQSSQGPEISLVPFAPSCGASNGFIQTTVTGGQGLYTYAWDNGADVKNPTLLGEGTYCVTVTDEANCSASDCIDLAGSSALTIAFDVTHPTCGEANGDIRTAVTGGDGNYTFTWDNADDVQNPTGLTNGTYCLSLFDNAGCLASECVTLEGTIALAISLSETHATCGEANGAIATTIIGGNGTVTYTWDNTDAIQNPINLAGGSYCVTATDETNCTAEACVTILQGEILKALTFVNDASCGDETDGSITVDITGGTAPYTFLWDNGSTDQSPTGLAVGNYCLTITDAAACTYETCATVSAPSTVEIIATVEQPTCGLANGSISIATSGGMGLVGYEWTNTSTNSSIGALGNGTYCVSVSDANACVVVECFDLFSESSLSFDLLTSSPSCAGGLGVMDIKNTGGVAPFFYEWSTGETTQFISDLVAGNYCLTVTDSEGCEWTACDDIIEPTAIELTQTSIHPICFGDANGSLDLTVTGGTEPYVFDWNYGVTTEDLTAISSGEYCVTVTDANLCTATLCSQLTSATAIEATATIGNVTCIGDADGELNMTVAGGNAPYTYTWSTGATTDNLSDLSGGNYCVTITDTNACTTAVCFDVVEPEELSAVLVPTNPLCFSDSNGSINLMVSGGTTPYSFIWENDETNEDRANLSSGAYCVTILDANGCTVESCATLVDPDFISIIGVGVAPTCTGGDDASIDLIISGGEAPYTYTWDNGATVSNPSGLTAGTYCVTVTDVNTCIQEACTIILEQAPLTIELLWTDETCDGADGTVEVNVLEGAGSYSYLWDTPAMDTNDMLSGLSPGVFTVTVTDASGCTAVEDAAVAGPDVFDCYDLVNIGDQVWLDEDKDGLNDAEESGVAGITVTLVAPGEDGLFNTSDDVLVDTQITDMDGMYLFEEVPPGTYVVVFLPSSLPSGAVFTDADEGASDELDSDAGFFSGQTAPITVIDGQPDVTHIDAGIFITCDNITNGGEICCDQQVCGAGADPAKILSSTVASGGSGALEYLWMFSYSDMPFDPNNPAWVAILDSNDETYDPTVVYQTTYYIRCARRDGCTTFSGESNIVKIEIIDVPAAEIIGLPNSVCENEAISFSATNVGTGSTYTWDMGLTASPATATTRIVDNVSWASLGEKTVNLTVEYNGCTNSTSETLDIVNCAGPGEQERFVRFAVSATAENRVDLTWETNPDLNDHLFVIEHSKDGQDYTQADILEGGAMQIGNHQYHYTHENPRMGYNYYRIKHLSTYGLLDFTSTKEVKLTANDIARFGIFPNPIQNHLNIEHLEAFETNPKLELINAMGTIVMTKTLDKNSLLHQLDMGTLPSGVYYVMITEGLRKPTIQKLFKVED